MEAHPPDPTGPPSDPTRTAGTPGEDRDDAWDRMSEQFASLGRKLKDTYRQTTGEAGPSEEEVRAAFRTLGGAWDRFAEAIAAAARDEQVRQSVKQAATGFFEAVGSAFADLGQELRRTGRPAAEPDPGDDGPGQS